MNWLERKIKLIQSYHWRKLKKKMPIKKSKNFKENFREKRKTLKSQNLKTKSWSEIYKVRNMKFKSSIKRPFKGVILNTLVERFLTLTLLKILNGL